MLIITSSFALVFIADKGRGWTKPSYRLASLKGWRAVDNEENWLIISCGAPTIFMVQVHLHSISCVNMSNLLSTPIGVM